MHTHYIQSAQKWCLCSSFVIIELYSQSSLTFDHFQIAPTQAPNTKFSPLILYIILFKSPFRIFYAFILSIFLAILKFLEDPFRRNRIPFWRQKFVEWYKVVGKWICEWHEDLHRKLDRRLTRRRRKWRFAWHVLLEHENLACLCHAWRKQDPSILNKGHTMNHPWAVWYWC
jgi:hypothetical protein